ncbi:hypothetical protein Q5X60_01835 [Acinetobacter baumannii]|uniref:hypothetical protein n=1 Tax=Acinetobacter baumannii TaxID=470 RepID=UPI0007080C15|nr:hypothetical protein [Acinetobacter baumannii]KQG94628.1 hypothetical protein APC57_10575 [Acinetobacter baumannii]MDO7467527.1 hypothetical protein [Acinetobacter baumannii]
MNFLYRSKYVEFEIGHPLAPLLYCIYEMVNGGDDLEYYLRGTIGKDPMEPVGGDPGWSLIPQIQDDGKTTMYYAWVDEIMGLEPNEGEYEESIVKYHIRLGLEKVLKEQPSRKAEIYDIFKRYEL